MIQENVISKGEKCSSFKLLVKDCPLRKYPDGLVKVKQLAVSKIV